MKRVIYAICLVLLLATLAYTGVADQVWRMKAGVLTADGPVAVGTTVQLGTYTVATRPAATTANQYITVTDGVTASDCTVGGGSNRVLCRSTGTIWEAVGGGGFDAASIAETNTGTSTTKGVTPDSLAGSLYGTKQVQLIVVPAGASLSVGMSSEGFIVPEELNGMALVSVGSRVSGVSSSGTPTFKVEKFHLSAAGTEDAAVQMLSTNITIDASEYDSKDATTAPVISAVAGAATVATGDRIVASCVTAAGTGTLGGNVRLGFRLP